MAYRSHLPKREQALTVLLTTDERAAVERIAAKHGVSLSSWTRAALIWAIEAEDNHGSA